MSIQSALSRVAELQALVAPAPPPRPAGTGGSAGRPFAAMLQRAGGPVAGAAVAAPPIAGGGAPAMVALAQAEVGQAEAPPGSNDSTRIAEYRTATRGAIVGPWCAYFVSWLAARAGTPLGEQGQGFGRVDDVYAWAQRTGRALPGSAQPSPGDLIVWDEHIGMVEAVLPDGRIQTIEGNSSDQVARRTHAPGSALGYVRMG